MGGRASSLCAVLQAARARPPRWPCPRRTHIPLLLHTHHTLPACSSLDRLDAELTDAVAALAGEGPSASELARYKKAARMQLLGALGSNSAVAGALASYQVR